MGRGDKKSAKGKRAMGSFGNVRKKKVSKPSVAPVAKKEKSEAVVEKKPAAKKPAATKKTVASKPAAEKKPAVKKAPVAKKAPAAKTTTKETKE
jgi:ribosomal small subunit protein bTHX